MLFTPPTADLPPLASSPKMGIYEEAKGLLKEAKDSCVLYAAPILSASVYLGWKYAPNINTFFEDLATYIRETSVYTAAANAGDYAAHLGGKLKEAERSHLLYQLVPLTIGTGFAAFGAWKAALGIFGYDSGDMRKEFLNRAYQGAHNGNALSTSERVSYLTRAAFGSMGKEARLYHFAEASMRFLVAAACILPIYMKDRGGQSLETPSKMRFDDMEMRRQTHEAKVGGYSRENTIKHFSHIFTRNQAVYGRAWQQSMSREHIQENAQQFATEFLDSPTGEPSFQEQVQSVVQKTCDSTAGFTRFADKCEGLAPTKVEGLFSTNSDGFTTVNHDVLDKACEATEAFIHQVDQEETASSQARGHFDSACSYLNSTRCQDFKDWALPKPETEKFLGVKKVICETLKNRALYGDLFSFAPDLTDQTTRFQSMLLPARAIEALSKNPGANQDSRLLKFARGKPDDAKTFTQNFFNLPDTEFSKSGVNKAYRYLSRHTHPDKSPAYESIFKAGATLKEMYEANPDLYTSTGTESPYYTTSELFGSFADYFKTPDDFGNS